MQTNSSRWSVAIFAARESIAVLSDCVRAVLAACRDTHTVIDVLVNGNRALAEQAIQFVNSLVPGNGNAAVRIWHIPLGDKAHAWNEYTHHIWQASDVSYFVDGYAEVRPDALKLMHTGLQGAPESLGATATPTSGRTANALRKQLLKEGGMHGNLYAIRGTVMADLKQCGFRLPLGLYRTDSLLGAVLIYRLDPAKYRWDVNRILVHPQATWYVRPNIWWMPKNLLVHFKRLLRQAQGILENRAVREHLAINRHPPEALPRTSIELVNRWVADHRQQANHIFRKQPLTLYAARKLRQPRDWSTANLPPVLLVTAIH